MNSGWMYLLLGVLCGVIGSMIANYLVGFIAYRQKQKAEVAFDHFMMEMLRDKDAKVYKDENGNVTIFTGDDDDAEDDTDCATDSKAETKRDCGAEKEDSRNTIG